MNATLFTIVLILSSLASAHSFAQEPPEHESPNENAKFCFLQWCFENIIKYFDFETHIKELESKTLEIVGIVTSGVTTLSYDLQSQINGQDIKLEEQKQANLQQQAELERQQKELDNQKEILQTTKIELTKTKQELQNLEKIKSQREAQLELERQQHEQERQEYERQIHAERKAKIEALATQYPIIKGIMSGTIKYYIEPVPDYAIPEIRTVVVPQIERMLDEQSNKDIKFQRVYNDESPDFILTWKRDVGTHLGTSWRQVNEVGLGSSTCWEDWVPFDSRTVALVTWHEIGHAVGFDHSSDTRNIMYRTTDDRNIYEIDRSYSIDEGSWYWLKFCESGTYRISIESAEKNHGFEAHLIPPSADPNNFLEGQHYPNCSTDDNYVSWNEDCSVRKGDYLVIYNPDELLKFSAIDVSIKIVDIREREPVDLQWDQSVFHWFDQDLMREVMANYKPAY